MAECAGGSGRGKLDGDTNKHKSFDGEYAGGSGRGKVDGDAGKCKHFDGEYAGGSATTPHDVKGKKK